jgi:excisionase family DNA binding protein
MMDLLTVDETAKLLKVAPVTVRRYIAAGRLPAVRVGRSVRVRRESVGALLKPVTAKKLVKRHKRIRRGRPFTLDDPLWNIVGIADKLVPNRPPGPTDVSSNKYKYLAEAYLAEMQSDEP